MSSNLNDNVMGAEGYKYMVCARCITYNHAPFIKSALDGFAMQQTDFPVVYTVIDDCSTDGEPTVIREWIDKNLDINEKNYAYIKELPYGRLFFARHKENANADFAIILLNENHTQTGKGRLKYKYISEWRDNAKYWITCEGDDYWCHPLKLKKQVDFLENHPDHSACIHAHRSETYIGDSVSSKDVFKYPTDMETLPDVDVICNKGLFAATASLLYRSEALRDYPEWAKKAPVGDKPRKLVLFARGHFGYINEVMSVYRIGVPGSWTNRVMRNKKAQRKLRKGINKMMREFDNWSGGKYHKYVKRYIAYYNFSSWKANYLIRPYLFIKKLFLGK